MLESPVELTNMQISGSRVGPGLGIYTSNKWFLGYWSMGPHFENHCLDGVRRGPSLRPQEYYIGCCYKGVRLQGFIKFQILLDKDKEHKYPNLQVRKKE